MKQAQFRVREALANGLRPDEDLPRNSPFLFECYNMKPSANGLQGLPTPVYPIGTVAQDGTTQLFEGSVLPLLVKHDEVYTVDTSNWTVSGDHLTAGAGVDATDNTGTTAVSGSGLYHAAGDGIYWVLANGSTLLTNSPLYSDWAVLVNSNRPVPRTVCLFQGRLIAAEFPEMLTYYDSGIWFDAWNAWRITQAPGFLSDTREIGSGWVMIGMPNGGSADIPFGLEMALLSGYKESELGPIILEAVRAGLITFVRSPYCDGVRKVLPLANRIMVYGDQGVWSIAFDDNGRPVPVPMLDLGVAGNHAAGGSETEQLFLTSFGDLYRVLNEYQLQRLGYREYLSGLSNPRVTMDPRFGDFYIADDSDSFVWRDGLGEARYRPISLLSESEKLYGTFTSGSAGFQVVTHTDDRRLREQKTIETIELDQERLTSLQAAVDYRYAESDSFSRTSFVDANPEDVVFLVAAAVDHRLVIKGTDDPDGTINEIRAKYKTADRRFTRGLAAQPADT